MALFPVDVSLDCTGLFCPEPVIRTATQVREMSTGQVLQVIGDDPGLQVDIPAWCLSHGHEFLRLETRENLIICTLRVAG
jgi:tRNA 2-thiouridine synthesizing protein A